MSRTQLAAGARAAIGLAPKLPAPSALQVERAFTRATASGLGYALAALVLYRTGHSSDKGPYVAMAAAMVPQILLLILARYSPDRRRALRTTSWPMPLHAVIAVVLATMAVVVLVQNGIAFTPGWAAAVGAVAAGSLRTRRRCGFPRAHTAETAARFVGVPCGSRV